MPLSNLDPTAALVVVDVQIATTAQPTVHPTADVVARTAQLAAAFHRRSLPVVWGIAMLDDPPPGRTQMGQRRSVPAEMLAPAPGLDAQPTDVVVEHRGWSVFGGTGLAETLRETGVTQVVLVGLVTSLGVESSARDAYDAGFHVVVVADATTDLTPNGYVRALENVFPILGEVTTTDEVLDALG